MKKSKKDDSLESGNRPSLFGIDSSIKKGRKASEPSPSRRSPVIKAGIHVEKQKFGEKPPPDQESFDFEGLLEEEKQAAQDHQVEVVGIDLTVAQTRALDTIQRFLTESDYRGNTPGQTLEGDGSLKYKGHLPTLTFTRAEYLDAFGVGKRKTARGKMEHNSKEAADAVKALRDLSENRYLFYYERKYRDEKGRERVDAIRTVRPLINITEGFEALTLDERDQVKSGDVGPTGKLKALVVEPCPILVDQIKHHFILKPANVRQEIALLTTRQSAYATRFIDYLWMKHSEQRTYKGGYTIKINFEKLAYKLRMEKLIKSRQWARVRRELKKCYDLAKKAGYVKSYKTQQGTTKEIEVIVLNPEKFQHMEEIQGGEYPPNQGE